MPMVPGLPVRRKPRSGRESFACGLVYFRIASSTSLGALGRGALFMEVFLALIFGLAVACVVFVLGRTLVGSAGNVAEEVAPRSELSLFANATPNGASAIVETVDAIEMQLPAASVSEQMEIKPRKRVRKRSSDLSEYAVNEPRSPRSRKSRKMTLPGTDVVQ
jgi:hypothetical protein